MIFIMRVKASLSLIILAAVGGSMLLLLGPSIEDGSARKNNPSEVYRLEIRKNEENGYWWYEIYQYNTLMIKQEFVPGISRKTPFTKKEQAKIIGELVVNRLNNNQPPIITKSDLEKHLRNK